MSIETLILTRSFGKHLKNNNYVNVNQEIFY